MNESPVAYSNFNNLLADRALTQPIRRCLYGNVLDETTPFWNGAIYDLLTAHHIWNPLYSALHMSIMLPCMPRIQTALQQHENKS